MAGLCESSNEPPGSLKAIHSKLASKLGAVVDMVLTPVLATVIVVVLTGLLFSQFKLENHLLFHLLPTLMVKKKLN
ncbi:hypothetical protein ANN_15744 [Periplaneta americana]|uniref:Uncharacterized protein n=1 Tax=Periplaneta americana TaxID=6978 RepID=A0ABQ8SI93_PERAM|nr:hypothetical protein ANN_15744 [Periplaneta americana]